VRIELIDLCFVLVQIEADSVGEKRLLNTPLLEWETSLTIGAGWDTTGTALSNALFHLITQPTIFVKLRKELDHAAGIGATYDIAIENSRLAELSFLQAVMWVQACGLHLCELNSAHL
jgi:cytochrome P450